MRAALVLLIVVATSVSAPARQSSAGGASMVVPAPTFGSAGAPTAGPPATGTGLILGRAVDGSTGKPIQGATIVANSTGPNTPGNGATPPGAFRAQSVVTGGDGRFVFRDLPTGSFVFRGSMPGYLVPSPVTVSLGEGEKANDVELRLWRSGVVAGQVLDEQNEGVEGITISLLRMDVVGGRRSLSVQQSATTDDRGAYRFAALTPGDYGVCALFSRRIAPIALGVAQGSGNADLQQTMSGSSAGSPSGSGYRLGDLMMIQASGSRNVDPAPREDGRFFVFADVCYPSASVVQSAQAVHVDSGQERGSINLVLRLVQSARILGTIVGPPNRVPGMGVHLYPAATDDLTMGGAMEAAQTITDPNGGFGFIGVPAGSYVLRVVYAPRVDSGIPPEVINQIIAQGGSVPPEILARSRATSVPAEPTLWATASVNVGETDVTGVTLTLREGVRIAGSVVFDGAKARPTGEALTSTWIAFGPADGSSSNSSAQPRGWIAPDGKFATSGVVPGRYLIGLATSWPGWTLKSIVADGRDVSDEPLDVTGGDVSGVVITMTDRPTTLSGTVRDGTGAPDRRARVLVFPSDRARWTQVSNGRRTVSTGVSKQGAFTLSGLLAGDYFVVAVNDQAGLTWQDPKTLDALSRLGSRVTIRDGEQRTVDLVTSIVR